MDLQIGNQKLANYPSMNMIVCMWGNVLYLLVQRTEERKTEQTQFGYNMYTQHRQMISNLWFSKVNRKHGWVGKW